LERPFYPVLSLRLLDLGPDILERDRPIEDERSWRGIRINTEISLPLELIAIAQRRARETRFDPTRGQSFQRVRIQHRGKIFRLTRIRRGKKRIVQAYFGWKRVGRRAILVDVR